MAWTEISIVITNYVPCCSLDICLVSADTRVLVNAQSPISFSLTSKIQNIQNHHSFLFLKDIFSYNMFANVWSFSFSDLFYSRPQSWLKKDAEMTVSNWFTLQTSFRGKRKENFKTDKKKQIYAAHHAVVIEWGGSPKWKDWLLILPKMREHQILWFLFKQKYSRCWKC